MLDVNAWFEILAMLYYAQSLPPNTGFIRNCQRLTTSGDSFCRLRQTARRVGGCSGTPIDPALVMGVPAVPTYGVSDGWLQRTALCAHKIGAILKVGFRSKAFPF
jgi:hypothetical protein